MAELKLTGISIGYDNNLIYECSDFGIIEDFKAFLEPGEVKRVDKLLLWFDSDGQHIFLTAEPKFVQDCNDEWIVTSEDIPGFSFRHSAEKSLYDEIEYVVISVLKKIRTGKA